MPPDSRFHTPDSDRDSALTPHTSPSLCPPSRRAPFLRLDSFLRLFLAAFAPLPPSLPPFARRPPVDVRSLLDPASSASNPDLLSLDPPGFPPPHARTVRQVQIARGLRLESLQRVCREAISAINPFAPFSIAAARESWLHLERLLELRTLPPESQARVALRCAISAAISSILRDTGPAVRESVLRAW